MIVGSRDIEWYDYFMRFGLVEETKHKRKKNKQRVLNVVSAFDIETSTIWLNPDHSEYDCHAFMYIWQMQIEEYTIIGRTWEDFIDFIHDLEVVMDKIKLNEKLSERPILVIWVHNLAFEWNWLSYIYPFKNEECFFRDKRKPLYCRMYNCFEFRCSYIQTNLSLSALCKQTGVKQKLSGQKFNYEKVRFPWTELSPFEIDYCITDVESLVQAMKYRISKGGDTLVTVPLTSTGYVRRECKEALKDQYLDIREMKPGDKEVYRLLRDSFRGGNTHSNRYMVNKVITGEIYSYDISSSYPTQQLTQLFPMKKFRFLDLDGRTDEKKIEMVFTYIGLGYAVVGKYRFKNIRLKNKREPIPYISLSRCDSRGTDDIDDDGLEMILDNGRILQSGFLEISCTEIDLSIILDQYSFSKMDVVKAMVSKKDYLPKEYREVIQNYYNRKTLLKGDESEEGNYMYMKSKNMLNAVYGMSATDPVHQNIIYDPGHLLEQEHTDSYYVSGYDDFTDKELEKLLKDAPFPYHWGVYTTSLARKQLQDAIKLCGDKLLYVDTDSVKVLGKIDIEKLNKPLRERAEKAGAYADDKNGKRHYIGVFELDGQYEQFITQGAKRYAYITKSCKYAKTCEYGKMCNMGITVAGVSKKKNEETGFSFAVEELKSLDNFRVGMTWEKAGGTISVYNDNDDFDYTDPETGNIVHIIRNVAIVPGTYTMTYSKDYNALLNEIQLFGDYRRERE